MGWNRQWHEVQEREGNPDTPGQWIEQGNSVGLDGRIILGLGLTGSRGMGAKFMVTGLLLRGVMDMEEAWLVELGP